MSLPWDLEERVEDAVVALLKNAIGNASVVAARQVVDVKYPHVVVDAGDSANASEDALFNGLRRFDVTVAIVTEVAPDAMQTARESHRNVKSAVLGRLMVAALHDALNELQVPGVVFSMAHATGQTRDEGDYKLTTEQAVDIIAAPQEI